MFITVHKSLELYYQVNRKCQDGNNTAHCDLDKSTIVILRLFIVVRDVCKIIPTSVLLPVLSEGKGSQNTS